ncbi:hypothetical protein L484_024163 [Morus notabilis]|uniref:Thionin-like protein n=1 Tax=Morus notabilis TaxID=981085 RepID=W9RMA8_9ROSA|nr:hypothetical protein L484_024163 [Morus notabilis]
MKKTGIAVFVLLLALSYSEMATAGPEDCIDACYTGCVQGNTRLMQRCEGKCRIRCGPDSEVKQHVNEVKKG